MKKKIINYIYNLFLSTTGNRQRYEHCAARNSDLAADTSTYNLYVQYNIYNINIVYKPHLIHGEEPQRTRFSVKIVRTYYIYNIYTAAAHIIIHYSRSATAITTQPQRIIIYPAATQLTLP